MARRLSAPCYDWLLVDHSVCKFLILLVDLLLLLYPPFVEGNFVKFIDDGLVFSGLHFMDFGQDLLILCQDVVLILGKSIVR